MELNPGGYFLRRIQTAQEVAAGRHLPSTSAGSRRYLAAQGSVVWRPDSDNQIHLRSLPQMFQVIPCNQSTHGYEPQ